MNYSVLMSVYAKDNPEYLVTAIESMLNQTIKPEQFVIVQDGAVGKELEKVLMDYQMNFPTVFTLVKLKENGGLPASILWTLAIVAGVSVANIYYCLLYTSPSPRD